MENNLIDLKSDSLVVNKLSETLDDFETLEVSKVSISEQWRSVERTFDMVKASIVEREREIRYIERLLSETKASVGERKLSETEIYERSVVLEEREKEIDERRGVLEKEIDERRVVLEEREKEIEERRVVLEERRNGIDERRVLLEERETEIEERRVVLEERENEIDERSVVLEKREMEIDERCGLLEERETEINEKSVVSKDREKEIDEKSLVLEERRKEIDNKSVELEERAMEINEKRVVLKDREKEIDEKSVVLEEREREINEKRDVLEDREKEIDEKSVVLEEREKEINEKRVVLEVREDEINKKGVVLEEREWLHSTRTKVIEICKGMKLTEARINEEWASLDEKEKVFSTRFGVIELEEMETSDQLFKNMDVNGVLSYAVENETELNVCRETLLDHLRLAPEPAKLVLKVTQTFHESRLGNNGDFNGKIGCINLLVGLMKLEEDISVCVRKEAEIFAANLGSWVVRQDCSPLDVLCFLQFVVSFKLYDTDEILMFLQAFCIGREVRWSDENTKSRYELGLSKKLSALVQFLILREKHLEAVLYICAFKIEDAFSLGPLLDAHLKTIRKTVAQETDPEASSSAQDTAANMELNSLRNMLKFISYFKLEPNYSTDSIELHITHLEKEIGKMNVMAKVSKVKIEKN